MTLTEREKIIDQRCDLAVQQGETVTELALSDAAWTPGLRVLVNVCHRVWLEYLSAYIDSEDF